MPNFRWVADAVLPPRAEPGPVVPGGAVETAWFEDGACCNCGARFDTPYCGQCGQKAAGRFLWKDIAAETWDRVRLFEFDSLRTIGRLFVSPGTVAREYVLGRRTGHVHPLKLLLMLIAVLVLILAANRYFGVHGYAGRSDDVDRMAQQVMAYANWSFSIGIVAIFLGGWAVYRKRLGYNAVEHGVLAVYCQSVILALIILNLLPTMIWDDPAFILRHKAASSYYIPAIKLAIVAVAYRQFFLIDLKTGWPRLLVACLIYLGLSWVLLRLYAAAILWLVSRTT